MVLGNEYVNTKEYFQKFEYYPKFRILWILKNILNTFAEKYNIL